MASTNSKAKKKQEEPESDPAVSYDEFKEFEGQKYTGMKIGRSHKWYYDQGEWKEKKVTPDLWEISYAVTKRRAGRAPEGSGVPVDTEYHWYILAHQNVRKLNANEYTTSMAGLKFKIAHRRAGKGKWSVSDKGRRKRMIRFLRDVLEDLEQQEEGAKQPKKTAAESEKKVAEQPSDSPATRSTSKKAAKASAPKSMKKAKRPSGRAAR
jgi:hypothetical protein